MDANETPLTYGVRRAMQDSSWTTYQVAQLSGVSAQNLYRFLSGARRLSQDSLDALGKALQLTLVKSNRGNSLTPGPPLAVKKGMPSPGETPLSGFLRLAVEHDRKGVKEIAGELGVTHQQLYRFLDPTPGKTRGLSQERLDVLCALLGLVVEGPMPLRTLRKGVMFQRVKYIPRPSEPPRVGSESGRPPSDPASPPPLFVPAEDSS